MKKVITSAKDALGKEYKVGDIVMLTNSGSLAFAKVEKITNKMVKLNNVSFEMKKYDESIELTPYSNDWIKNNVYKNAVFFNEHYNDIYKSGKLIENIDNI